MSDNPTTEGSVSFVTPVQFSDGSYIGPDIPAQFKDGVFNIPAWVVPLLGGPEIILKKSASFKHNTFKNFMDEFHRRIASNQLNRVQQGIIDRHMQALQAKREGRFL